MEKSQDAASRAMLKVAERQELNTIWDRFAAQTPQCGFGELGTCCRNCLQGPCRIDPFGEGATLGACGASADTIVARNLCRAIAAGTAAHSGHAKHLAHTLLKSATGRAPDYPIRDEAKLQAVAARLGLATAGKNVSEIAQLV
ncbi:MAG: carbon monoxide dehydrogenase, partial [Deltaproteobacteria bacterium]|nr:carbon monoxide dehydrogenase [Deltaproteobacteria bacterium]